MFEKKTIGKPCAEKPHARFDEEAQNCSKKVALALLYCLREEISVTLIREKITKTGNRKCVKKWKFL